MWEAATQAHEAEVCSRSQLPLHVLIVEDYADGRETLRLFLELSGYWVDVACDGVEGVEKAIAVQPQVALIDIGLPRLNGYEVARRLRARFGNRIRLVACTAYGQPDDVEDARRAGFDLLMVKPINADTLLSALESLR